MIKKEKVGNRFQWSLEIDADDIVISEVSVDEKEKEEYLRKQISEQHENKEFQLSEINHRDSYIDLLKLVNKNFIDDILFMRKEIERKNDHIASQQKIIDMLLSDRNQQKACNNEDDEFKKYKKTFKPSISKENPEKSFSQCSRYQPLYNFASEQNGNDDDNEFIDDVLIDSGNENLIKQM